MYKSIIANGLSNQLVVEIEEKCRDPEIYTVHQGGGNASAFPREFGDEGVALTYATQLLRSRGWSSDMWIRIDGPRGAVWNTNDIRRLLNEREGSESKKHEREK